MPTASLVTFGNQKGQQIQPIGRKNAKKWFEIDSD
jgi:hypothetical protein